MAEINTINIPYPDFQSGDIIDAEKFDANNKALVDKQNEIITHQNGVKHELERHKISGDHDDRYVSKTEGTLFTEQLAQHKNSDDHDERYALNSKVDILEKEVKNIVLGSTNAEVGQARVGVDGTSYDTLKERVDAEYNKIAEQNKVKNNIDYFLPTANISPKLIYKMGGVTYIVTQKPNGNGYIRIAMKEGLVTSDSSVGGSAELLRLVEVKSVIECFVLNNIPLATSGSNWAIVTLPYETHTSLTCYGLNTSTINDWLEYEITVPNGVYSTRILAYQSNGSSNNVNILVDGVVVLQGVSFQGEVAWKEVEVPLLPGKHTIKIESKANGFLTIAGVNMVNLNDYKSGHSYSTGVIHYSDSNPYITNGGAVDYALFDSDINLWCGSYHGGEVRNRLSLILDNNALSLANGDYYVGKVLEIEQDTRINNKINAYSRYVFKLDGVQEFEVYFEGNINVSRLFTNMTTTHFDYTQITYPKRISTINNGDYYLPSGSNYVIQKNPTNNQKIITIMNDNILPNNTTSLPYVSASQYYKKVYKDNVNGKVYNLKNGQFKSVHIFE